MPASRPVPPDPAAPPTASSRQRHLGGTGATAPVVALAVAGLGVASAGDARLGMLVAVLPATVLALDVVVSVQATRRLRIAAIVDRSDVVVGDRFTVTLALAGPRLPVRLALPGGTSAEATVATPPATGPLHGVAEARGVVRTLTLEPVAAGLCALVTCTRTHHVRLARPLEIGPRPIDPGQAFPDLGGGWGSGAVVQAPAGDVVRGVRAYVPGDRLRQVHWRATARLGELVVKEADEPQAPALHLVVDLGGGGQAGEDAAGRAAWWARQALLRGHPLVMTTIEEGRTVVAPAPTPLAVSRRLARAGSGHPAAPGVPPPARMLLVTAEGDSWR